MDKIIKTPRYDAVKNEKEYRGFFDEISNHVNGQVEGMTTTVTISAGMRLQIKNGVIINIL